MQPAQHKHCVTLAAACVKKSQPWARPRSLGRWVRAIKRTVDQYGRSRTSRTGNGRSVRRGDHHVTRRRPPCSSRNTGLGPPFHVIVDLTLSTRSKTRSIWKGMTVCWRNASLLSWIRSWRSSRSSARNTDALCCLGPALSGRMPSYLKRGTYADDDIVEHVGYIDASSSRRATRT